MELKFATHIASNHIRWVGITGPFIKKLEELSVGELKITPYLEESLMKNEDSWERLKNGTADIAAYNTAKMPWRFPLSDIASRPGIGLSFLKFGAPDAQMTSNALWSAYEQLPEIQAEWQGLKMLALHLGPCKCFHTVDKVVRTPDDAKGMKIQCVGELDAAILNAVGAVPVKVPVKEAYKAMKNGEIDGYLGGGELLVMEKLGEVSKYTTLIDGGRGTVFWVAMNQQKWDSLPEKSRSVLEQFSGRWLSDHYGAGRDKKELSFRMQAKDEMGHQFYSPLPDEAEIWADKLSPLADDYIGQLEVKGLPGYKVRDFFKKYKAEYKY